MSEEDWWILAALLIGTIVAAYVVGRRSRGGIAPAAAAPQAEEPPAPERKEEEKEKKAPPPAEPAKASAPERKVTKPEPIEEPPPNSQAPSSEQPTSGMPKAAMATLKYEEDDDVDPTRIGPTSARPGPRKVYQPPLMRIVYDEDADSDEPTKVESMFLVHATAQTDTGLRRKRNEDSLLVDESTNLFVVADGMGGYRGGERASQLAVTTIGQAHRTSNYEGDPHENVPRQVSELARAIQMANASILDFAAGHPELQGMGTTVCAARFSPNKKRLYLGHVGDSRCYRLRDGVLKQMTKDHTMADFGVAGPESAHLSRAVGVWPTVPIDAIMSVPLVGDVYLLCSDGLTKMLTDEHIGAVVRAEDDPKAAVERLIFFANSRGGKDNITVILIRVAPPNWKPRPSVTNEAILEEVQAAEAQKKKD